MFVYAEWRRLTRSSPEQYTPPKRLTNRRTKTLF